MTGAPDISAEAVERLAKGFGNPAYLMPAPLEVAATLRALRAALDAAERERDEARGKLKGSYEEGLRDALDPLRLELARDAADATGYARGVRDAAGLLNRLADEASARMPDGGPFGLVARHVENTRGLARDILALLPATDATKETRDA